MKSFKTKTAAESWGKQIIEEHQDSGRSNVLSRSELAEYREAKGIIRWLFLPIMLGLLLCGTASVAKAADNITVMSFNILRQAWQPTAPSWDTVRKAAVIQTIQDKSPDFVGTQEENDGQLEDIIAGLPVYAEVPGRGVSGGILYLKAKWNLVSSGKTLFVRYDAWGDSRDRYFIWGLFTEKATNRMIYVYSNHLTHSGQATLADRVAGMEQMATHAANRQQQRAPVILTGDFNSTADIDTMRTLTGEIGSLPIEFIYAYQDVQVTDVSHGIDHILALPGTVVVDSGVAAAKNWDSGSDHPAVFAVIEPWFGNLSGYPNASVRMEATDPTATEAGETTATFSAIREGDTSSSLLVNFSVSGTATEGVDYVLSAGIPVTIPAGQSSVDIVLTPTDDTVFGERSETVTLTITVGTAYDAFGAPATATIEDNDNHAPVAYAGVDKYAVLGAAAWSPADIATTAWYDASDTDTITASSGAVSVWQDKSGNGNHATQSAPANQPATGGDINGLNAITFDPSGPNHLLTPLEQLTTVSLYVVGDYTARGGNAYGGYIGANAAGYSANSGLLWRLEDYATSAIRTSDPVYNLSDSVTNRWVNGSYQAAPVFGIAMFSHQGTGLPTANLNYFIGSARGDFATAWGLDGSIGEIIICPEDHDLATRQKMEGYLAHKWGVAANLPSGHPYKESAPQEADAVSVTLADASISDADANDSLTQSWEVISKPAGAADPRFRSTTVINPIVTFIAPGTYQLRLTGSDGTASTADEVTLKIHPQELGQYWIWADGSFTNGFTDNGTDADSDGDGLNNLLEFAFGTDPTDASGGALATDGSAHGQPKVAPGGAEMELFFLRRKDHGTSSSVTYSVEFSGDLTSFHPVSLEPSFVANSSSNADYEVVKVPFPASLPDSLEARFGRIVIAPTP